MQKRKEITIRVHSTEERLPTIRKHALKLGATIVTTNVIAPNLIEAITVFKKKAEALNFEKWLAKERNCSVSV